MSTPQVRRPGWGLQSVATSLWQHRRLVFQLAGREIRARYRGSLFGGLWAVIVPLFLLAVYSFVFGVVFQARWGVPDTAHAEAAFPVVLFAGLAMFWMFSEAVGRAPGLVRENTAFVKKIVFPVHVLPWVPVLTALFNGVISLVILIGGRWVLMGPPPLTTLLLPLVVAPFVVMTMGVMWLFSSVGMYMRDLGHVVGVLIAGLLFLSPIFYPAEAVPEAVRIWMYVNPLTFVVEQIRALVIWGELPDWQGLGLYLAASWGFAWLALQWFLRTEKGFADVL